MPSKMRDWSKDSIWKKWWQGKKERWSWQRWARETIRLIAMNKHWNADHTSKTIDIAEFEICFLSRKKLLDKLMTYMIHEFLNHMVTKWNMISNFFADQTEEYFWVCFVFCFFFYANYTLLFSCSSSSHLWVRRAFFSFSRNLNLAMLFVIDMCCHLSTNLPFHFQFEWTKQIWCDENCLFYSKTNDHA